MVRYGATGGGLRRAGADLLARRIGPLRILIALATVLALALGGAAIARATGAFDDGDAQLTGPQADRAKAAALRITGGGKANAVERDSEKGATYEGAGSWPAGALPS